MYTYFDVNIFDNIHLRYHRSLIQEKGALLTGTRAPFSWYAIILVFRLEIYLLDDVICYERHRPCRLQYSRA